MGEIQDKEKIAELCGAIIGDGWIQSDRRCFFIVGDPLEDKEYYDKYLSNIFKEILIDVKPKEFPYWKVYGIGIYKKEIIKRIVNWGLPTGKKVETAKIPDWIKKANKKVKISFIRGFFDTDGSIFCQRDYAKYAKEFNKKYHTKIRLRMSGISEGLINQIEKMNLEVGFNLRKRIIKRGFKNNRNNKDVFILEMNKISNIVKFFEELKPSNPKHITKYMVWKKFGFCPPYTKINQRKDILKKKVNPYKLYGQG